MICEVSLTSSMFARPRVNPKTFKFEGNKFTSLEEILQFLLTCTVVLQKKPVYKAWIMNFMSDPVRILDAYIGKNIIIEAKALARFFNGSVTAKNVVEYFSAQIEKICKRTPARKFGIVINEKERTFTISSEFFEVYKEIAGHVFMNTKRLIKLNDHHFDDSHVSCVKSDNFLSSTCLMVEKWSESRVKETAVEVFDIPDDNLDVLMEPSAQRFQSRTNRYWQRKITQSIKSKLFDLDFDLDSAFLLESIEKSDDMVIENQPAKVELSESVVNVTPCVAKLTQNFADQFFVEAKIFLDSSKFFAMFPEEYANESSHALSKAINALQNAYIVQDSAELLSSVVQAGGFVPQLLLIEDDPAKKNQSAASNMIIEALDFSVKSSFNALVPKCNIVDVESSDDKSSTMHATINALNDIEFIIANFRSLISDLLKPVSQVTQSLEIVPPPFDPNFVELLDAFKAPLPPLLDQSFPSKGKSYLPQKCIQDGSSKLQPFVPHTDPSGFAANLKPSSSNLGSNLSSGQSGTSLTHELPEMLANLDISSKSSLKPAPAEKVVPMGTDIGGSPPVQSSGNPPENVPNFSPPILLAMLEVSPHLPPKSSPLGGDIGVGDARLIGDPSKDPLEIVPTNVGVSGNPHADHLSFVPQGDNGGSPVQVLAQSGDPPGYSGGADPPKTPSSNVLWSDSSKARTYLSASLPPPNLFGSKGKPVRPLPPTPVVPKGTDIGGRPPVAHSSGIPIGNPPESAATTLALSLPSCPSGHDIGGNEPPPSAPSSSSKLGSAANPIAISPTCSPLGGNIGVRNAHSSGDPPEFVHASAPSLSSKLRSAATPALSPLSVCSLGHDIGGTKRSGEMLDIAMVLLLGGILCHLGVPIAQAPLFSHIPPEHLVQAVEVA
jgi:hypothetical protein